MAGVHEKRRNFAVLEKISVSMRKPDAIVGIIDAEFPISTIAVIESAGKFDTSARLPFEHFCETNFRRNALRLDIRYERE
jgi:hypothetical protein